MGEKIFYLRIIIYICSIIFLKTDMIFVKIKHQPEFELINTSVESIKINIKDRE